MLSLLAHRDGPRQKNQTPCTSSVGFPCALLPLNVPYRAAGVGPGSNQARPDDRDSTLMAHCWWHSQKSCGVRHYLIELGL